MHETNEIATFVDNAVLSCKEQWKANTGLELNADDIYALKNTLLSFFKTRKRSGIAAEQVAV